MIPRELNFYCLGIVSSYIIYKFTRDNCLLENRLNLLENNINNIKERIADLELFKLKTYNNEVSIGRRVWENLEDEDEDDLIE